MRGLGVGAGIGLGGGPDGAGIIGAGGSDGVVSEGMSIGAMAVDDTGSSMALDGGNQMALSWLRSTGAVEPASKNELSADPISYYLAAYNALETVTKRAQNLIDSLHRSAMVLSQFGASGGRSDAWKTADIEELDPLIEKRKALSWRVSLTAVPTAQQLLDAICDWREKRKLLDEKWSCLPADVQAVMKSPDALDS
jgi:hypothetical protein